MPLTHVIPAETIRAAEGRRPALLAGLARAIEIRRAHDAIPLPKHWFTVEPAADLPDGSVELTFRFELEVERTFAEEALDRLSQAAERRS